MTDINKSSLDKVQKYIANLKQNPMPTKRNPFAGKNNPLLTPSPKKKPTLSDTFSKDNYVSLPTIASSTSTGISFFFFFY